jgi:hypothetical protein
MAVHKRGVDKRLTLSVSDETPKITFYLKWREEDCVGLRVEWSQGEAACSVERL